MLNAEAGPLYGMILPILISVSVAPASYCLVCAEATALHPIIKAAAIDTT
jgi:hypothetical protein